MAKVVAGGRQVAEWVFEGGQWLLKKGDEILSTARAHGDFDPRFDPRVKEQERLNNLYVEVEGGIPEPQQIPLGAYEGRPFVTSMSDRTAAGETIVSINGQELKWPIDLWGGQDYMFDPLNTGKVWASAPGPVGNMYRLGDELAQRTGEMPLFIPWRMAPTGGDFAHMTGETMLSFAQSNMNKTTKKALDRAIRKLDGDWPGIDAPEMIARYRGMSDTNRKALKNMVDVEFRDRGGLSIGEARLAVADPKQVGAPEGGTMNVGEINTNAPITTDRLHPTYPSELPGRGLSRLPEDGRPIITEMLGEGTTRWDADAGVYVTDNWTAGRNIPDLKNPSGNDLRALQMKPYGGVIDDQMLSRLSAAGYDVGNADPRLLAAVASAALATGVIMSPEEAEAGPITRGGRTILEAFHGSPHKFDRFDMSKIGTGEGAQAYGHGLYFTDTEDVARGYRESLVDAAQRNTNVRGGTPAYSVGGGELLYPGHPDYKAADIVQTSRLGDGVPDAEFDEWLDAELGARGIYDEATEARVREFRGMDIAEDRTAGGLYRTEIDIDPDTLLDWDKPLSEQTLNRVYEHIDRNISPEAARALQDGYYKSVNAGRTPDGADFIEAMGREFGQREASAILRDSGIPGIRYLDGMSRPRPKDIIDERNWKVLERHDFNVEAAVDELTGLIHATPKEKQKYAQTIRNKFTAALEFKPTHNYVIFDDKPIRIVERGFATPESMALAAIPGAVAAYQMKRNQQAVDNRQRLQDATVNALHFANDVAGKVFVALDMPLRGYMGMAQVASSLLSGADWDSAVQKGGAVAAQDTEVTAHEIGGNITDVLTDLGLPPEAAAAGGAITKAGLLIGSPI